MNTHMIIAGLLLVPEGLSILVRRDMHDTIELTVAWKMDSRCMREVESAGDDAELLAKEMHEATALDRLSRRLRMARAPSRDAPPSSHSLLGMSFWPIAD